MIHHFNQRVTADVKLYHTWLYVKCTIIYDHICTQIWRSVSGSRHGNVSLNTFPWETRVRSPLPQCLYLTGTCDWLETLLRKLFLFLSYHKKNIWLNAKSFLKFSQPCTKWEVPILLWKVSIVSKIFYIARLLFEFSSSKTLLQKLKQNKLGYRQISIYYFHSQIAKTNVD